MNIYDFIQMYSYTIEHAKRKMYEREQIRKIVNEYKRRKARAKIVDNHINFYYFKKGSKNK